MESIFKRSSIALLALLIMVGFASAAGPALVFSAPIDDAADLGLIADTLAQEAAAPETRDQMKRYIIVLDEPPLASYRGGIRGLAPTAVDTAGGKIVDGEETIHLAIDTPAAKAYVEYLKRQQARMINKIKYVAPEFTGGQDWSYTNVLNGFSGHLRPAEAMQVLHMPGIRLVYPAEELFEEMDSTLPLIGAYDVWEAMGGDENAGLGSRVAILEAGNAPNHDFFHDEGMPDAPEGFPSARVYEPGDKMTELGDSFGLAEVVNNKTIGFRAFMPPMPTLWSRPIVNGAYTHTLLTYEMVANGQLLSGHGTHVSGTVAGRFGEYEILPNRKVMMGGVAPMAHVFNYPVYGDTSSMIKAFEVMAEEEIDAVNLSLGTINWLLDGPETHPVSIAMSGAADAGVLVVGSAGNAGANGRTSLSGGWKYSEDLMVVGNTSTTGRSYLNISLDDAPDELLNMRAGLRSDPPTEPITGTLVFREDGGCSESEEVAGKIAVVERFLANGSAVGPCNYASRATNMMNSGALAIIYIYYDRAEGNGTGGNLPFPSVALGSIFGEPFVAWLKDGNTTQATIDNAFTRDYLGEPDVLNASSSRGPGLNWEIKPDISAPGTNVVSSVLNVDRSVPNEPSYTSTWPAFTGTSMAAPHITGSAGLLRSIHPDWTVPQLRSALINTAIPIVKLTSSETDPVLATPNQSGPGRVELVGAADPGALFFPPKASFGAMAENEQKDIEIRVDSASEEDLYWDVEVQPMAGRATVSAAPEGLAIAAGESETLTISLDTSTAVTDTEHWGYVVLTESAPPVPEGILLPALLNNSDFDEGQPRVAGDFDRNRVVAGAADDEGPAQDEPEEEEEPRTLRVVYYAYVDIEANREDVLIVNWTYGDTPDHTSFYTEALDEAGLGYEVFNMGEAADHPDGREGMHPTFEDMYRHDLVILNANESTVSLQAQLRGQYQYQNYMLSGGSFLIAGQGNQGWWRYLGGNLADNPAVRKAFTDTWPMQWLGGSQNVGCEMCLARYFAGYTPELTATLSARLLVPYPMAPDKPEMEVVLEPHPEADGPFDYPLDISTGGMAKDGAAGNQYTFNSGSVVTGYRAAVEDDPLTDVFEDQRAANLGDTGSAELVIDRIVPIAKPLWSYEVMSGTVKTVGTYVAGKHNPDSGVAWNAMYWGFGLEGVGENGEGSASRAKLIGDTFNFMARNMEPDGGIEMQPDGSQRLRIDLGEKAADVRFVGARIDWGDGTVEELTFDTPTRAEKLKLQHKPHTGAALRKPVKVKLLPEPGTAAPVHLTLR